MIPRYEYIRNSDGGDKKSRTDDSYFKKCKFILRDRLILKCPELLFGAYMYYEAIQTMVVAKAIALSKRQDAAKHREDIGSFNSLQKRLEIFQTNFLILFFADAFDSLGRLNETQTEEFEKNSDEIPFGKLFGLMCGEEEFISLSEALLLQRYFRQGIDAVGGIEALNGGMSEEWHFLCDVLGDHKNVRYMQAEDDLVTFNEQFKEFIAAVEFKRKKRCLLLGRKGRSIYFTISGIHDSIKKVGATKGYEEVAKDIKSIIKELSSKAYFDVGQRIIYVKAETGIRFYGYEPILNGISGKLEELESLESPPNDAERKFSCCERKLSAYCRNRKNGTKLSDFEFLLCRYDPCPKCYMEVKDLTNFYVYGDGFCEHLLFSSFGTSGICDETVEFIKHRQSGYSLNAGKEYVRWKRRI